MLSVNIRRCLHEAGLNSDRPDFSHFSFCSRETQA